VGAPQLEAQPERVQVVTAIECAGNEVRCVGEPLSEPIYWIGRQWAVTVYGVECRKGTYAIAAHRLWEGSDRGWPWEAHLAAKDWVDRSDAENALALARERFAHLEPMAHRPRRRKVAP
jgi:hypothetical protein